MHFGPFRQSRSIEARNSYSRGEFGYGDTPPASRCRRSRSIEARNPYSRGEFWPSRHGTKESYASGGTPPQRNSAAVMSRGMVMAESSVVTATIRVLNR